MRSVRTEGRVIADSESDNGNSSRVDLNNLMARVREEEKKTRRNGIYFSAAAVSVLVIFGIVLTL